MITRRPGSCDHRGTHLGDIDDILVVERQEDVDLPDGCQWEALGLALHLDLLQCKDLPALPLPSSAYPTSWSSHADACSA